MLTADTGVLRPGVRGDRLPGVCGGAQHPARICAGSGEPRRVLAQHHGDGIDRGVDGLESLEHRLHRLPARNRPHPDRGGQLVERRSKRGKTFYACSKYPDCKFVVWARPIAEPCPRCAAPFLTERIAKGGKRTRACIRGECGYKEEVAPSVA